MRLAAHVLEFPGGLPQMSNFYCHPGKAGGSPFLFSGLAPWLKPPLVRLHVEQAIYMVNSIQFAGSARLVLVTDRQSGERTYKFLRPTTQSDENFDKRRRCEPAVASSFLWGRAFHPLQERSRGVWEW